MTAESKSSTLSGGGAGLVSMLEKPWLLAWSLRILIVTLFIDLALVTTGKNSLYLKGLTTELLTDPGSLLLALSAFGGYVCLLAPATFQIFKFLVWFHLDSTIPYRAPDLAHGYLGAQEVRKRAMMSENQFWLSQYDIHEKASLENRDAARTLALLLWTVFTLALVQVIVDGFLPRNGVLLIPALLGIQEEIVVRTLLGVAIGAALLWAVVACLDLSIHDAPMYCPPYAEEEYRKMQEAAKRKREFEERMLLERSAGVDRRHRPSNEYPARD